MLFLLILVAPAVVAVVIGLSAGRGLFWQRTRWVQRVQRDARWGLDWPSEYASTSVRADRALAAMPLAGAAWLVFLLAGLASIVGTVAMVIVLVLAVALAVLAFTAALKPKRFLGSWYREPLVLGNSDDMSPLEKVLTLLAILLIAFGLGSGQILMLAVGIAAAAVVLLLVWRSLRANRVQFEAMVRELEPDPGSGVTPERRSGLRTTSDHAPTGEPEREAYPLNPR
jgi:hypothetical protein